MNKFPERVRPLGNRVAVVMEPAPIASADEPSRGDEPMNGVVAMIGTGVCDSIVSEGAAVYFSYFDATPITTSQGVVHIVSVDRLLAKVV